MPLIKVNSPVIAVAYISARIHPGLADHPVPGGATRFGIHVDAPVLLGLSDPVWSHSAGSFAAFNSEGRRLLIAVRTAANTVRSLQVTRLHCRVRSSHAQSQ